MRVYIFDMEELSSNEWSLIARCLKKEAGDSEQVIFNNLLLKHPALHRFILMIQPMDFDYNPPSTSAFDSTTAFDKLDRKLKNENLL